MLKKSVHHGVAGIPGKARENKENAFFRINVSAPRHGDIFFYFWEALLGRWSQAAERSYYGGFAKLRKKNFKGRCEKRVIAKCSEVCLII